MKRFVLFSVILMAFAGKGEPSPRPWHEVTNYAREYMDTNMQRAVVAIADVHDVSPGLLLATWNQERGPREYEFGQRRIRWGISIMFLPGAWQPVQAACTIRRAFRGFIKTYPEQYAKFKGSDAEFMDKYTTRFAYYLVNNAWQPESNRNDWAKNVIFYHAKWSKRLPEKGKAVKIQ